MYGFLDEDFRRSYFMSESYEWCGHQKAMNFVDHPLMCTKEFSLLNNILIYYLLSTTIRELLRKFVRLGSIQGNIFQFQSCWIVCEYTFTYLSSTCIFHISFVNEISMLYFKMPDIMDSKRSQSFQEDLF